MGDLHLLPVRTPPPFAIKSFRFTQPGTLELDGHIRGTPIPSPNNAIFPSLALAIDQAYIDFDGASFTLRSVRYHSDQVCLNGRLLRDDKRALQDGDVITFGKYRREAHTFGQDCAVRVSIPPILPPPPDGTNWSGVRDLVQHVRSTTAPRSALPRPATTCSPRPRPEPVPSTPTSSYPPASQPVPPTPLASPLAATCQAVTTSVSTSPSRSSSSPPPPASTSPSTPAPASTLAPSHLASSGSTFADVAATSHDGMRASNDGSSMKETHVRSEGLLSSANLALERVRSALLASVQERLGRSITLLPQEVQPSSSSPVSIGGTGLTRRITASTVGDSASCRFASSTSSSRLQSIMVAMHRLAEASRRVSSCSPESPSVPSASTSSAGPGCPLSPSSALFSPVGFSPSHLPSQSSSSSAFTLSSAQGMHPLPMRPWVFPMIPAPLGFRHPGARDPFLPFFLDNSTSHFPQSASSVANRIHQILSDVLTFCTQLGSTYRPTSSRFSNSFFG